ncbi:serine/threonine-protein kinase [Salinactinospora qingdaonensis]|uniref:Serine/threonine-protein kinase n=1 Tax=Salinactinospora qingdaonensis TaxID=702744 RepID=A0ABP7GI13_9ACTN
MAMTAGFPDDEGLPERIGPYTIRRRIGQGGMGVVYQAADPQDRLVAIKVLRPEVAGDDTARARLAREVETMRRVHSDNVAEVIDADTNASRPWVVTEYVPGPTLDATVTDHGPLRGRALTRFVGGLAQALKDIHAAGVIHRDLKPGNVIISNGEPIVIDFGIAHAVDGAKLTQTGTFVGTPSYLSPEVIEGTDLSPATDVHAWGATVTFAATGNPPYGAGAFEVIFYRILNGEISMEGMPRDLQPLVQAAVSRDMAARPTAAGLVAQAGRLNLDLPWAGEEYQASGVTGKHTVQVSRPEESESAAPVADEVGTVAHGMGAAGGSEQRDESPQGDATHVYDPEHTLVAGSGADQTMVAPEDAQRTGLLPSDEPAHHHDVAPQTQYFNSTLRPEEFRDVLPPVDYDQRRRPDHTSTFPADDYDDEHEQRRGGLFGRWGGRRGEDRLSDYLGSDDDPYEDAEPRRLPSLILLPLLLVVCGLTLMVPTVGAVVGVLAASILGALDTVKIEQARRLQTRGPRSSDSMVVVLSMPWALVRNTGRTLLYGLGYLLGGIIVGLIIGFALGKSEPNNVGAYAMAVVVLLSFLGPNGQGTRRQATWLTENIGIRNPYVYWGSIVAICLLALFLIVFGVQASPAWDPIAGPSSWFAS